MNHFIKDLIEINIPNIIWLYNQLNVNININLSEIGYNYQDYCNYDGNILSALDCAMFEAYCYYKNNTLITSHHALILKNCEGIVGVYNGQIITIKNIIELYEGNNLFHEWLCDLANNDIYYYL